CTAEIEISSGEDKMYADFTVSNATNKKLRAYLAKYNKEANALAEVKTQEITDGSLKLELPYDASGIYKYKAFVWHENNEPVGGFEAYE
ncbi:MAG: hypothetical protein IJJ55_06390, partial [Clostridia bacterium]|nr:hypothetical protein [Clostridia bacterium]